ncbi:hypothetical protein O181_110989 [Austropuccinia psidii MF-1]|uniref:Uncharacterized protein n=1 Tax=Austropuccinia psidii MF-1 TaxID=1389203 RepID=A0A9Q3JZA0_9BASI|nr:hypothetical protein [Austropuccinia psidii MF-1]
MVCSPWAVGAIGDPQDRNQSLSPNFLALQGTYETIKMTHGPIDHLNGLGSLEGSRAIKILTSPKLQGRSWVVVPNSAGHPSNTSPYQPPAKRFQSQVIPSTPRTFQPTFATIPPASPNSSHTSPALNPAVTPSPIQQSRNSPIVTSQQLQPVASTSRRREELSPLPFPAAQVFQHRDQWPI